jgi:predicted lipoprotein
MRKMRTTLFFGLVLVAGAVSILPRAGVAADAAPDPAAVSAALLADHVIPRYQALADATGTLDTAAAAFCAAPDAARLGAVETAYNDAADAWMGVQHIQFGPIELLMRSPRLYFWPDPTGRAARDVTEFAAMGDPAELAPDKFRAVTVSLQGLPAAEALLYDADSRTRLLAGDAEGQRRCALLRAIAGNVRELTAGLLADWRDGDDLFLQQMRRPGPDNPYFASQDEVTAAYLKSLNHALRLAGDTRLKPVLGADIGAARPDRAEAWRSGRSLRNIIVGLEAAQALYLGEGSSGIGLERLAAASQTDAKIGPLLTKAFAMTLETAHGIGKPLPEAVVDPATRPRVEKLATQIQALRQLVGTRLATALNLSVGFNALDGD